MTPNAPQPEIIEISYKSNPPGQIGTRPRNIKVNSRFKFTTDEPGTLSMKFTGDSPLADGNKELPAGTEFIAAKPGHYKFMCVLDRGPGQPKIVLGDPENPSSAAGGEMVVVP